MTSFDRPIEAEPHRWPTAVLVASTFWIAAGGITSAVSIRAAEGSGRFVLLVATLLSVTALAVGFAMGSLTGRATWLAVGLVVSGLAAPTTFAYPLNAVPIAAGIALAVWARRSRRNQDI